jgi:Heterokaryon incompatibility protein (HET)
LQINAIAHSKMARASVWPSYNYEALPPKTEKEHYIRVLDLLPAAHREERLDCVIHNVEIGSGAIDGPYEALSYVWGNDTACDFVLCGKARVTIGRNLSFALRRLRRTDQIRTLWIDAICINQKDVEEKEVQVRSMYQVYFSAQQVIIFVGEPASHVPSWDPQAAFKMAAKLAEMEDSQPDLDINRMPVRYGFFSVRHKRRRGFPAPGNKSYTALRVFFTLPWFNRMWVVQEAACAAKAIIVSGEYEMSWHDFMRGTDFGLRSGLFAPTHTRRTFPFTSDAAPRSNLSTAIQIYRLGLQPESQSSFTDARFMDLFQLLRRFHGSCAEDPRDKVFALLGLASLPSMAALEADLKSFKVQVDYRVEVNVLFQRLAQSILKASKCLDLLSIPSCLANGPSWVPDWSALNQQTESLPYTAALTYHSAKDSEAHPDFEDDTLILSGLLVDRVAVIVDRDLTRHISSLGYRAYLAVVDGKALDFIMLVAFVSHCFSEMTKWETLAPSGPDHTYITGEYYYDVYRAIYRAARTHFESQWYGSAGARSGSMHYPIIRRLYISFRRTRWVAETACCFSLGYSGPAFSVLDAEIIHIRTFARTEQGYLALVPPETMVGDTIAICQGGKMPLVLRGDGPEKVRIVGDCYVHGIMNGEKYREEDCHAIRIC